MLLIDLTGKTAVVCGATQGIGWACAQLLAKAGATVILLARNQEKLIQCLQELDVSQDQQHTYKVADFTFPTQVKSAAHQIAEKTNVHILVNNTGGPAPGNAIETDVTAFADAFAMHLINCQLLTQAFVPSMKQQKYGRIINIISTSVKTPIAGLGVSNTIRGAVASWAKTIATELAPWGITVNNILPGLTQTARLEALIAKRAAESGISPDEQAIAMQKSIPTGRFALPSETASAVVFLASTLASYITGINLPVDGGLTPCL